MSSALASYEYHYGTADWLYQLLPDRVVATGRTGPQRFEQVFELSRYFEYPNWNVNWNVVRRPWIAWLSAATFLLIALTGLLASWEDLRKPADLVVILIACGGSVGVYYLAWERGAIRQLVTQCQFRQHDYKDSFIVWRVGDERKDEFDHFVNRVQGVIRSLQPARSE